MPGQLVGLVFIGQLDAGNPRAIKISRMLAEVLLDAAAGNSVAKLGHNCTVSHVSFQLLVGHAVPLQPAERVLGFKEFLKWSIACCNSALLRSIGSRSSSS